MITVTMPKEVYDKLLASHKELLVYAQGGPVHDPVAYQQWACRNHAATIDRALEAIAAAEGRKPTPPEPKPRYVDHSKLGSLLGLGTFLPVK